MCILPTALTSTRHSQADHILYSVSLLSSFFILTYHSARECNCGGRQQNGPIKCSLSCEEIFSPSSFAPWSVYEALAHSGHMLPTPINQFAVDRNFITAPLSVTRWLAQHGGLTFDCEILSLAAMHSREDILHFAHDNGANLSDIHLAIFNAAIAGNWHVVVWCSRNRIGHSIDWSHLQKIASSQPLQSFGGNSNMQADILYLLETMKEN